MKNLLIYINPEKDFVNKHFDNEISLLPRLQIDNSLELGWKLKDIMLITNFDWEYRGVKAIVFGDDTYNKYKPTATKVNVILEMFNRGMIEDEVFWYHDNDAFQLQKITEAEARGLLKNYDLALTDYGRTTINPGRDKRWSTGTLFFDKKAEYIFPNWKQEIYRYKANEEVVLLEMLKKKRNQQLKKRIHRINITYNFATRKRDILKTYKIADKPIKVIHFHPFDKRAVDIGNDNIGVCVYGKNRIGRPLVTKRLKKLFKKHKII